MAAWAAVALGGALGSLARYGTTIWIAGWLGTGFPYGTLAVNVVGGFVMGAVVAALDAAWSPSEALRLFLTVGVLGGYTTFSAFSADAWLLLERGAYGLAALYIGGSVVLSLAALVAGLTAARAVLA